MTKVKELRVAERQIIEKLAELEGTHPQALENLYMSYKVLYDLDILKSEDFKFFTALVRGEKSIEDLKEL